MLTFSLNSSPNGNAVYVEALGVRLPFDAQRRAVGGDGGHGHGQ